VSDLYLPLEPSIRLSPRDHAQIVALLGSGQVELADGVERRFLECVEIDRRRADGKEWTAHECVALCARACVKMGLRTPDIEHAVKAQQQNCLVALRRVLRVGALGEGSALCAFLAFRGDVPHVIKQKLEKAWSIEPGAAVWCAVRCLAELTTRTVLTSVDVHEAVRQVRDRIGDPAGGERTIWLPN
jgi:hypothetical protein